MVVTKLISADTRVNLNQYRNRIKNPITFEVPPDTHPHNREVLEFLCKGREDILSIVENPNLDPLEIKVCNYANQRFILYHCKINRIFTSSILLSAIHYSGYPPRITEAERNDILSQSTDLDLRLIANVTCGSCVTMMQLLSVFGSLNNYFKIEVHDSEVFKLEPYKSELASLPALIVNGELDSGVRFENVSKALKMIREW